MISERALKELISVLGPEHISTRSEDLHTFGTDATKLRFKPDAVAFPGTAEAISRILHMANQERFPVIPRGAGSGKSGGALPVEGGLILAMDRFNRILEIDQHNLIARAECGVITAAFQEAVEKVDLFYPPDPASIHISTLGGNVAECAGGLRAVKYGVTRDYVLGLNAVLPTGEIIKTGVETIKGVVGYDLTRLLIGSEGTLAVVTEIIVRLVGAERGAAQALREAREGIEARTEEREILLVRVSGDIMPEVLPPDDRAVRIRMEALFDAGLEGWREGEEHGRDEHERQKEEAVAHEREEEDEGGERHPGDARESEDKHAGREHEEEERESLLSAVLGVGDKVERREDDEREEVEAVDVRMAEGAEDARDGDVLVRESDAHGVLVEAEGDRQDAGDEDGAEQDTERIGVPDGYVGEEAERVEIEEAQELLESGPWSDGIRDCRYAPECHDEERGFQRVAPEFFAMEEDDDGTEEGDADTEELRERERDIEERDAHVLGGVVERHPDDDERGEERERGAEGEDDRRGREGGQICRGRGGQDGYRGDCDPVGRCRPQGKGSG